MAIDLSTIVYRTYSAGDTEPETPPTPGNIAEISTTPIILDGIKYRAIAFVEEE